MKINKKNLTSKKASLSYLQILILIISIFAFAYLIYSINSVNAQNERVQCCEKTINGAICQEFLAENIEENCEGTIFPGQCKDFANCELGCCYDSKNGICSANTPRSVCDEAWEKDPYCNIAQCQMGCCVLGRNAMWTTQRNCKVKAGFLGLQTDFRQDINTELECIFLIEKDDEGACVYGGEAGEEKTCKFTTRESCRAIGGYFYKEGYCSDSALNTNCKAQDHVGCADNENNNGQSVYWFDSCGNKEEVKEECSFFGGTICGLVDGEYKCKSLDCNVNGKIRKNGESWCVYDGTIGKGKDVVGSRHWKHTCFNGEEILEQCADFRNEICVQSDTELDSGGIFSSAACRINRWRECVEINLEQDAERKKERCENNVDCRFEQVVIADHFSFPVCTPQYPPGFDLKNRIDDANMVCGQASQKCIAVKVKKLSGWKWVANEDCTKAVFTEKMNDYCISLGDCGGYVNYVGEYDDGFNVKGKAPNKLSQSKINEYKSYSTSKPGQKPAEPGDFSDVGYTSISYSEDGSAIPTSEIVVGGIIGGISAFTAIGSSIGTKMVGSRIGQFIATYADKVPLAGKVTAGGEVVPGWAGFKNALSGSLGAAAGTYVMIKLAGKGLPSDAATVVSVVSSILGAVIGTSAAAGVTAGIAEAQAAYIAASQTFGVAVEAAWMGVEGAATELELATANLEATQSAYTAAQAQSPFITGLVHAFIWAAIVAGVMIVIFKLLGIGKTKKYVIEFRCLPWQAPTGGKDCDKCNGNTMKPCSDYRCHSLGQACEFINKGTGKELCIHSNPNDVSSPRISPLYGAITLGFEYYNIKDNGFEVVNTKDKSCIPEFTNVLFGIKTDKPSQCKIGTSALQTYDDMEEFFGGSNLFLTNHTILLSMPSKEAIENYENITELGFSGTGEQNFYVKCKSFNGAVNEAAYTIKTCVKPGPDLTAPYIMKAEPLSGSHVKYNATEQLLDVWVNEPSNCRWSIEDKSYELMENQMSCEQGLEDQNLYGWTCNTTLTNVNEKGIAFVAYIRCRDTSENNNTMKTSYLYALLISSSKLTIEDIKPASGEKIVSGVEPTTINLEVSTSGGAEQGKAECSYKFKEDAEYIRFYDTFSALHKQVFSSIIGGNYKIYVQCQDIAGNTVENFTEFMVYVDRDAPKITRVYYDGSLVVITNEDATCAYSFVDSKCKFDIENATEQNAELMTGERKEHSSEWQTGSTYYIKCKDNYGNEPGKCSIVVRPYDII